MTEAVPAQNIHGLHYQSPALTWDEGFPHGNGMLGALVWGTGQPLNISLDRSDLWDLRPVPEFRSADYSYATVQRWHDEGRHDELVQLLETPYERPAPTKLPAGRIELHLPERARFIEAHLHLEDARSQVSFSNDSQLELFVHAVEPLGVLRWQGGGLEANFAALAHLVAPPFSGEAANASHANASGPHPGNLAQLGYPAPVTLGGETWQAFTQEGAEGFRFAVYLGWRESSGETLAVWSVASSFEGADPLEVAKTRVEAALATGYEALFETHRAWWRAYWQQSAVSLPNEVLERQWYLEQYKFGAAARRGAPPITLQGPWTADDGRLPPWKGDYHHDLNTQLSHWPCYSGNHLREGLGFLEWLWDTRENCFAYTRQFFGLPGLNVPMCADLSNNQIGGWRQYTHSATTSAWLAHHFYLHWRYSMDRNFLEARAYPYLREVATFLEALTQTRDAEGWRTLPLSASPEINDNRPEAWFRTLTNYDLALLRWLFGATAELAEELGLSDEAAQWQQVLSELPELARGQEGELLIASGYPLPHSHRHHSHLLAIHPLGLIGFGDGDDARTTMRASLADLERLGTSGWVGYSFAWLANLKARAQDGAGAERALEIFSTAFTLRNSFHCNGDQSGEGFSHLSYRPFTLEGNFAAAAGVQEMLLQSHGGLIRVFPAVPDAWSDVAFSSLRAEGAVLVSAERLGGVTRWVTITSEKACTVRIVSPFGGDDSSLSLRQGQTVRLTAEGGP